MRETYKTYEQLKLFEDHALEIAAGSEGCPDCLFKHLNAIVGYAQEVVSLGGNRDLYLKIADQARKWRKEIFEVESGADNPAPRKYEPYGLTAREKQAKAKVRGRCTPKSKNLYCRLVRCIKKLEPRERAGEIESAVAVCRASLR